MKKIWIPASITTVAIGAFFVFQNAGVVSPKLGYWETVVDLSNVVVSPGASSGNVGTNQGNGYVGSGSTGSASSLVNKFSVNISSCEYRLRYKVTNNASGYGFGDGVGYNGTTPPPNLSTLTTFASSYASQVRRSTNGNITMSFSADGISPFKLYSGAAPSVNGGFPFSFSLSFDQHQTLADKFNGRVSVRSTGGIGGIGPIRLENGVSIVKLERRCYELPITAVDSIEVSTK